ncbi:MAG: EamA family transporter [Leptolyngbyaceae cyanobacterium]
MAMFLHLIGRLKPTAVSYLGLLSPIVATLIGYAFLQETLTPVQLLGAVTVLGSVGSRRHNFDSVLVWA